MRNKFLAAILCTLLIASCSQNQGNVTPPHEHTYDNTVWEYDETDHWHPSTCGHDTVSSKHRHIFNEIINNPTFENDGTITYECSVCGYSYTEKNADKLEHNYSTDWSHNARSHWHACIDNGYENLKKDEGDHTFVEVVTPPSYEGGGYTTHTCSICGYNYVDSYTNQLEHNYSDEWTHNEHKHWHACIDEGYEQLKTDETNHDFVDVVTDPTYETKGFTTHTCQTCGYSYVDNQTDELQHNYSANWEHNEHKHWHACIDAGYENLKSNESDHTFVEVVTPATYQAGGYTTHTCSVCGYSYIDNETQPNSITITWVNYDGTVLETDTDVPYGSTPSYDGETPTKPNYETIGYTFSGWSPEITAATEPVTYIAQYTSAKIGLKVTITYSMCNPKTDKVIKTYATLPEEVGDISATNIYGFNTYVDLHAEMNEGYVFVGWYYQGTLLSNYKNYSYVLWDTDVTLEARFCYNSYTLNIHTNNSDYGLVLLKYSYVRETTTISYESDSVTVYTVSQTIENKENKAVYETRYDYKDTVQIAAYSKTSTRFLGWYDENDNLVSTNAVYTFTMPNSDYTLEAKWNYFKVNYDLNGGTNNALNPTSHTVDEDLELYEPTRTGYDFVGWQYCGLFINHVDKEWIRDVTLTAIWDEHEYTITYELDGGTNNELNPSTYTINSEAITLKYPSKLGYWFNGWYTSSEYEQQVTSIKKGTHEDITLYAQWILIDYDINYKLHGGTNNDLNPTTYTVEDPNLPLYEPTREAYDFEGWQLNGEFVSEVNTQLAKTITLEAIWEAHHYTITYELDGGTNNELNPSTYTVEDTDVSLYKPTKEGYYFMYWKYKILPVTSIDPTWQEDITLTAIWEPIENCLNLDDYDIELSDYGSIVATKYNGTDENVVIPNVIKIIGEEAFKNCYFIKSVIFPENLSTIREHAFDGCSGISQIELPENLKYIGNYAFKNCTSLTSFKMGKNVTTRGSYILNGCYNLQELVATKLDGRIANFFSAGSKTMKQGDRPFASTGNYKCIVTKVTVRENYNYDTATANPDAVISYGMVPKKLTKLTVLTESIASDACSSKNTEWSGSMTIGNGGSFKYYTFTPVTSSDIDNTTLSLTDVILGDDVTYASYDTFYKCKFITTLVLPKSVHSDSGFRSCNIPTIYYKGTFGTDSFTLSYNTAVYYYSESEPTEEGNYWRYVDGVPTIWDITQ